MYPKIILLLCALLPATVFSASNDFDEMCDYFTKLDKTLAIKNMSKSQQTAFINERIIKNLKENSSARKIWEVIIYAVPEERYEMVKSTAIELLHKDWQCKSMKNHISKTGK